MKLKCLIEFISSSIYHNFSNWSHSSACKIIADHFHLLQRLRMHGAIPPFSIFMAWSLIRHRDYSTFTILLSFCSRFVLYKFLWLVTSFGVLWLRVLKESIRNLSRFILKKICASQGMYSAIADVAAVKLLAVYAVVLSCWIYVCFHASAVKTSVNLQFAK